MPILETEYETFYTKIGSYYIKIGTFYTEMGSFYMEIGTFYIEKSIKSFANLLKIKENGKNGAKINDCIPEQTTI